VPGQISWKKTVSDFRVKLLSQYQMIGIEIDIFEDEASEQYMLNDIFSL